MQDRQDEEAGSRLQDLPLRGTGNTESVARLKLHDLPLRSTSNTESVAGLKLHNLPVRGTNNTGSKSKMTTSHPHVLDLPLRGIHNTRSEVGSRLQGLPLRGTDNSGSMREETLSHPQVLALPLRGTENTGSMREETISHPHVHDLPLRGTDSTGSESKRTIPHPHRHDLPLRSTHVAGPKSEQAISHPHIHGLPLLMKGPTVAGWKSEEPISQAQMHNLPLQGPNVAGSKSKQTPFHPHNPTNHAIGKFSPDSQNETAAPATGIKRHNTQGASAPPLTWFGQGYRAEGTGITSHNQQALPTYCLVDDNHNVIQAGIVLERTDPSSARGGRWRVAKVAPATGFSSSVEQFAIGHASASHVGGRSEVEVVPATTFSAPVGQPANHPSSFHGDGSREADAAPATVCSAPVEQPETHPSTSHVNGSREADPTPAATFSAPVKQPAVKQRAAKVRAVFALRLFTSDFRRIPCRKYRLPPGSIELHSTLAAANAEARRVAGSLLSSAQSSDEKMRALQKKFDQKLQDLEQGVSGEGDEAKGDHADAVPGLRVTWGATRSPRGCWHSVFHSGIGASDFPRGFLHTGFLHLGYHLELCVVALAVDAPATASLFAPY